MSSSQTLAQLLQAAVSQFQSGDHVRAERLAQDVLKQFGEEANALMILGLIKLEDNDAGGAVSFLARARRKNPKHVHVLNNLGAALLQHYKLDDARQVLEEAVALDGKFAPTHNNLGSVLLDLGLRESAKTLFSRAVALDPGFADAIANLARMAEEEHRLADAEAYARRAIAAVPTHVQARLTLARVRMRDGQTTEAMQDLELLLGRRGLSANLRVVALGYLAECRDRLKQFDKAFAAFRAANTLQADLHAPQFERYLGYISQKRVEQIFAFCQSENFSAWKTTPMAGLSPTFLIGFPRSGTTLLDQILSSHPDVVTLDERDTLLDVSRAMMPDSGDFKFWTNLPDHEIERLQGLYWHSVRASLGDVPRAPVFVDKLPLNAVLLPLIYRLFPQSKIILALRDPRDTLLSCFQQRFAINEAMYPLLRLDSAVRYYVGVMGIVQTCRERLGLPFHAIRYEDVVADFDTEVGKLLTFLNLPWDDRVRDFAATARRRMVNTPSATQVVKPLYSSSVGKWRDYASHTAPFFPVLDPWVATYGYDP